MQNSAALAYQQVGKQTVSPRVLEANLLSRSAAQLQRIAEPLRKSGYGDYLLGKVSKVFPALGDGVL